MAARPCDRPLRSWAVFRLSVFRLFHAFPVRWPTATARPLGLPLRRQLLGACRGYSWRRCSWSDGRSASSVGVKGACLLWHSKPSATMTPIRRSSAGGSPAVASSRRSAVRPGSRPPAGRCYRAGRERRGGDGPKRWQRPVVTAGRYRSVCHLPGRRRVDRILISEMAISDSQSATYPLAKTCDDACRQLDLFWFYYCGTLTQRLLDRIAVRSKYCLLGNESPISAYLRGTACSLNNLDARG